jgi:type III pantothenate kinase
MLRGWGRKTRGEVAEMLLCIDIGNTNIKFGLFDGDQMDHHWRIATERSRLADEYAALMLNLFAAGGIHLSEIRGCAISSVVPALTQVFTELVQRYLHQEPLILNPETVTGMQVHTDHPAEVGSDLIANAVAARHLYGTPVIVVGFGTATTFVGISREGYLEGVAIAPGIITSGDSLFRATSTLPQVALKRPLSAIGKNTTASIQSGMVFGFSGLVEGVVRRMQGELGEKAYVVATGGVAPLIAPETSVIDTIEPTLTLLGLKLIYDLNQTGRS